MFQVYRFDFSNGGFYIGSTKNFRMRYNSHHSFGSSNNRNNDNPKLYNTWRKHGNPQVTILGTYANEKLMLECEQIWIDLFWNEDKFLNLNPKADRPPSRKGIKLKPFSESHKQNLRLTKGQPLIATSPDGIETRYLSTHHAAKELGFSQAVVQKYIHLGIPCASRKPKGWSFRREVCHSDF